MLRWACERVEEERWRDRQGRESENLHICECFGLDGVEDLDN